MYYYSEEESSSELTNLTANKVDLVIGEALSKRDLSYLEPLDDLKKKFDVRKLCSYIIMIWYVYIMYADHCDKAYNYKSVFRVVGYPLDNFVGGKV